VRLSAYNAAKEATCLNFMIEDGEFWGRTNQQLNATSSLFDGFILCF
jgi:hypothetical protein